MVQERNFMRRDELKVIRKLLGAITREQLRYVDCFVTERVGLFMPVGGACFLARSPLHSHPAYMFIMHFDSHTEMALNGKVITSRPGQIFSLSPGILHHEMPSELPPRYIAIVINKEFFKEQLLDYAVDVDHVFDGDFHAAPPALLLLLKRFMVEADNAGPGGQSVLYGLSLEICHALIRAIFAPDAQRDRISLRMEIDRAIEYLHEHFDRKISVETMAKTAGMSKSHFTRTFRAETGETPLDYLTRLRLERAKKLLLAGDKSITEIAYECGFSSQAYFATCFRQRFGTAPSAYRVARQFP